MAQKDTIADDIAKVSSDLISALDNIDTLQRLAALLEILDLMTDVNHADIVVGLYLLRSKQCLGELRTCVKEARSLLSKLKKKGVVLDRFYKEAS